MNYFTNHCCVILLFCYNREEFLIAFINLNTMSEIIYYCFRVGSNEIRIKSANFH